MLFFQISGVLPAAGSPEKPAEHQHHPANAQQQNKDEIGLDEHLGAKVPLDAVFNDESGRPVRLGDLITGPTMLLPVYYSCTNVCNYLQGGLARIIRELNGKPGSDYRIISISFNPDETPEQAARTKKMYLAAINAPFPADGWRFLTGDRDNIQRFTDAIGYRFKQQGHEFIHPVASVMVAGDGKIVRYLYGTSFLAKDVSLALLEARNGTVGTTIRKIVDFCFTFDPAGKTYVFNILRVSATVVILSAGSFLLFLMLSGKKLSRQKSEDI
ncbi:MAG: SCO family protein [Desulfuromonadales bacterium]